MRKLRFVLLTLIFAFWLIPTNVLAAGDITLSPSTLTITKGESKTFTITANNAAGRVDIASSNTAVATISSSSIFFDDNSETITVKGVSVGTTTINVTATDVTTYDDEDLSGKTYSVTIKVVEPTTNNNNSNNTNTNTNTNTNNSNNNNNNNTTNNTTKSTNNKLKEISIEGYELTKIDDNNYELTVGKDVESIKVNATAEDSKAKVTGAGEHKLNIGDNTIEVIVTSESGKQNKIKIKITKKEEFYPEDLDSLLDGNSNEIDIRINSDTKITTEQLQKIKEKGKIVNFNYFDGNNKLVYSWIVDGKKLEDTKEILTTISYTSNYDNEINSLSNNSDGLIVSFKHNGTIQDGVSNKIYVKDKFNDNNLVKIYYYDYNNNTLTSSVDNVAVKNGYLEFSVPNSGDYFLSISDLNSTTVGTDEEEKSLNIFMIISIVELIIIIILIVLNITSKKNKKKNQPLDTNSVNNTTTYTDPTITPTDLTTPFATPTMDASTPIVDTNNISSTSNVYDSGLNSSEFNNSVVSNTPTVDTSANSTSYYNTTKTVAGQSFITGTVGATSNSVAMDNQTNPYNSSQAPASNYGMNNYTQATTNTDSTINPFTPMNGQ